MSEFSFSFLMVGNGLVSCCCLKYSAQRVCCVHHLRAQGITGQQGLRYYALTKPGSLKSHSCALFLAPPSPSFMVVEPSPFAPSPQAPWSWSPTRPSLLLRSDLSGPACQMLVSSGIGGGQLPGLLRLPLPSILVFDGTTTTLRSYRSVGIYVLFWT
jgi:hypothetical protein